MAFMTTSWLGSAMGRRAISRTALSARNGWYASTTSAVTMTTRAYAGDRLGPTPSRDVPPSDVVRDDEWLCCLLCRRTMLRKRRTAPTWRGWRACAVLAISRVEYQAAA